MIASGIWCFTLLCVYICMCVGGGGQINRAQCNQNVMGGWSVSRLEFRPNYNSYTQKHWENVAVKQNKMCYFILTESTHYDKIIAHTDSTDKSITQSFSHTDIYVYVRNVVYWTKSQCKNCILNDNFEHSNPKKRGNIYCIYIFS